MNRLTLVLSLALAALTGCANLPSDTSANAPTPTTPVTSAIKTSPAPHAGVYPQGDMQPLVNGKLTSRTVKGLMPPADLWERIRQGFAMPDLDTDLVRDREQWYTARPDYIFRMTERSRKYLFHIVEELEMRGMPTELALLPFVESAFNPQAVSVAKAAGMWQFMPATGKDFDLKQNVFRDDRRDVLASTRAALDYLQRLYNQFGDWHLALAAYNWGEGSVGRAIAKNQKAGLPTGYTDLSMPMETRFYLPKLQAIKNIIADPLVFSARLPDIKNHPYFQSVPITRDIDVAVAARLADISVEDFKALNPSASRPVILAAGTPQILLPWDNATTFQQNLETTIDQLASWTAWVAPTTMKAADVAAKVGMTEKALRELNHIPARMLIKAGSTLLVPRGGHIAHDVPSQVADNGRVDLAPEIVLHRTTVKAQRGDNLASLAKRYGVSVAAVSDWNKLSSTAALKAGQMLVLHLPAQPRQAQARNRTTAPSTRSGTSRAVVAKKQDKPVRVARK